MIKYFVIAADGQKYGQADIATLNGWITEGRLQPTTVLQEENSSVQVEARGVPALKFMAKPPMMPPQPPPAVGQPAPAPGPGLGNPYDTPRPMGPPQPQPFSSNYSRGIMPRPVSSSTGPAVTGWLCTIVAPLLIYFTFIGLFLVIWGIRAGASLYSQGQRGQGGFMIALNILWGLMWLGVRFLWANGNMPGPGIYR